MGTRDPAEAKRLLALKLAEVEERWSNLRRGERPLSPEEIDREAAAIGERFRRQLEAAPYESVDWDLNVGATLWKEPTPAEVVAQMFEPAAAKVVEDKQRSRQRKLCYYFVDLHLTGKELFLHRDDREKVARAATIELQRAVQDRQAYLLGKAEVRPNANESSALRPVAALLTFEMIIQGWLVEKKPNQKTEYTWRRVMKELSRFLGHDDARRVRAENLVEWKADLLAKELKAKTIRDSKLAPVRAIFQWAVDNRKLDANPAARINIDLKARSSEKRRGYTDDEAKIILQAARGEREAHKRWVPWVCAYTGARISEICQLRSEDIKQIDGIWCIAFAAEAGSLKNVNSERVVPVHSALEEEGFRKFATAVRTGPLFADLAPDRFGSRGGTGTKILSRWIRSLGVTDKRISPNHSWRHRLKTLGRRNGLALDILDAMTGHGRKTVADTYGEFPPDAMLRELSKIPQIKF